MGLDWVGPEKPTTQPERRNAPKSHTTDPHRPDRYILITGKSTATIATKLQQLQPNERLTTVTTSAVDRVLKQWNITGHSFKHGAALILIKAVIDNVLPHEAMSFLLKHKVENPPLSPTTCRYVQDPRSLAIVNGSDKATKLL